jgi:hypothetical protein
VHATGWRQEITEPPREIAAPEQATPSAAGTTSSAERFGFQGGPAMPAAQPQVALAGEKPEGWTEKPSTQFRIQNYTAGPNGEVEVFLSQAGGGLAANINRWRTQMGLPDLSEQEIAELPKTSMLGQDAVLVNSEGTYGGMQGGEGKAGYRLAGVLLEKGGQVVTVKMVGPAEAVQAEIPNLQQYAASIKEGATAASQLAAGGDPHAGIPGMGGLQGDPHAGIPGMGGTPGDPHAVLPMMQGAMVGGMAGAGEANFDWKAPEGWEQAPDRPMRVVTFNAGENTEVYVSLLSGPGGGAVANINRWRHQMGVQEPLSAEQIAELPKVNVLGAPSPLVEVAGQFTGMSGEKIADAKLLGVVCEKPDQSVFVKMTGPAATVDAQKDNFVAFVESLSAKQQ